MMLTENQGLKWAFIAILVSFIKARNSLLRGTFKISETFDQKRSMKSAEIKDFFFQLFLFGLLEARGEGESRARIRCLPVRQSKSDSKMGWVKFLVFEAWLPYHRVSLSLAKRVLQGLRFSLGSVFLNAFFKGLNVDFGRKNAFYAFSSLNKN